MIKKKHFARGLVIAGISTMLAAGTLFAADEAASLDADTVPILLFS